ncbi:MAG: hybrid sensor histidine kinase/response regulator [Gaiellaceae bacterium]
MSEVDGEFLDLFRDEANERLDHMVETLLALESGTAAPDALDSLFRDAHTIKGGAGMLGFDDARALAHAIEDVLEGARATGEFPPELAEPLLRAADALRRHVAGDGDGSPDLLEELAASRAGAPSLAPAAPTAPGGPATAPAAQPGSRAIRVPAQKIDRLLDLVGETVLHRRRLEYALTNDRRDEDEISDELDLGGRLFDELKDAAIQMRTVPLATITGPFPRAVRDIASAQGKDVDFVVVGEATELDRVILETLAEPLVHLIRNAVGHGVESPDERRRASKPARARVELRAEQRGGFVEVTVADDGRGVSQSVLDEARREGSLADVLARAGFSTAVEVTDLSGRGVGLDAVKRYVESFGGTLAAKSEPGAGTAIVLLLPLALALVEVLLIERGGQVFGVPLASVERAIAVDGALPIRVFDLADLLGADAPRLGRGAQAVVLAAAGRRIAVGCDRLLGQEEVVLKPLGQLLPTGPDYLGAAILGDGRVALVLDTAWLTRATAPARVESRPDAAAAPRRAEARKVLVVEDSHTVRALQRSILEAAGYRVETAHDGRDALERLAADAEIELVVTDLEMPELDGIGLTRAIRAGEARPSLPVIVVTSRGDEESRRRGLEAGADAYVSKQEFSQQFLLETVERLIGR